MVVYAQRHTCTILKRSRCVSLANAMQTSLRSFLLLRPHVQDCTSTSNPDGISGREWCYVEVDALHVQRLFPIRVRAA